MHIVSLIVFYVTVVIFFLLFMKGAKHNWRMEEKAREEWMKSQQVDKLVSTELSLIGLTDEDFRKRYQGGMTYEAQPHHLQGD